MKTSKYCSTISYNTEDRLIVILNEQLRLHNIAFWAFIKHKKEEDEAKDHIHLLLMPDGPLDTSQLDFTEFVPGESLPRNVMPWRTSKFDDWYLYTTHNETYLAKKGQTRQFHYTIKDVVSSNHDFLLELVHGIDWSKLNQFTDLLKLASRSNDLMSFISESNINLLQFNSAKSLFDLVHDYGYLSKKAYRGKRKTHTPLHAGPRVCKPHNKLVSSRFPIVHKFIVRCSSVSDAPIQNKK